MTDHRRPVFDFVPPPELAGGESRQRPVVVVGAGPVGLTAAIDLALRGIAVVLVDDDDTVSIGSRAICYAKRTLEIWDRLGVAQPMVDKGVTWNDGRVWFRDEPLYRFTLRETAHQKHPAFINLQQYYCEEALVARARALPLIELRWRNRVTGVEQDRDRVVLDVETPAGGYRLAADYVIAADGARSTVRRALGLEFRGRVFEDRFLIADVRMRADFPNERWFWFDPPFNPGQSALLHMQADDVWRIDLQLGADADPEVERRPERVMPRIRRMLGPDAEFDLEWTSVYTFQCRMLERFRHGRVLFAGDAAHQVSPFGARGANSGVEDACNLCWKLALVLNRLAPDRLLDSYDAERVAAAQVNILNSTRSTEFITPKGAASRAFRDAALHLAGDWPFARDLVNSGRLARASSYPDSPLNTASMVRGSLRPGDPCPDAPLRDCGDGGVRDDWLLDRLGDGFTLLSFGSAPPAAALADLAADPVPVACLTVAAEPPAALVDHLGIAAAACGMVSGGCVLIRPDHHVAACWPYFDAAAVHAAVATATAQRQPAMQKG